MNILICSSDNSATSGAFLCLVELCRYLKKYENVNILVVLPSDGTGTQLLNEYNIAWTIIKYYPWVTTTQFNLVKRGKSIVKKLINYFAIQKLVKIIKEQNIDIVHSNSSWSHVGIKAAEICGIKTVWHFREIMELSQGLKIIYTDKYVDNLIKHTDEIIAVSKFVKGYFEEKFSRKIKLVYDSVDCERYYLEKKEIFKTDRINILLINAIYEGKHQHEFFMALNKMPPHILRHINVFIVGDDKIDIEYTKKLYSLIPNNIKESVIFAGVSQNILEYYRLGDISCICSPYEAFGRVTLESMLAGCCVIGCNSGATGELIKDGINGYLYESGNIDDLAGVLRKCIDNKNKSQEIAEFAQNFVKNTFSLELTGDYILDVYKSLLEVNNTK